MVSPPVEGGRHPPRPKKSLGQHFLVDRRVLGRIADAADLLQDDLVLEVGPGRGFLTKELAERVGRLVALEIDEALAAGLRERFDGRDGVTVLVGDARRVDIDTLAPQGAVYKLVANLPYFAASPIIRRFLEAEHSPALMVVMVQREVAREMVAAPGKMGMLSVATQVYGNPRIVAYAPPRAFRPAPKVTSAVVRIEVYERPAVSFDTAEAFFRVVRAGFSAPRKQLRNSLRHGLGLPQEAADAMLARAGIEPTRRAQTLTLPEWGALYETHRDSGDPGG